MPAPLMAQSTVAAVLGAWPLRETVKTTLSPSNAVALSTLMAKSRKVSSGWPSLAAMVMVRGSPRVTVRLPGFKATVGTARVMVSSASGPSVASSSRMVSVALKE